MIKKKWKKPCNLSTLIIAKPINKSLSLLVFEASLTVKKWQDVKNECTGKTFRRRLYKLFAPIKNEILLKKLLYWFAVYWLVIVGFDSSFLVNISFTILYQINAAWQ